MTTTVRLSCQWCWWCGWWWWWWTMNVRCEAARWDPATTSRRMEPPSRRRPTFFLPPPPPDHHHHSLFVEENKKSQGFSREPVSVHGLPSSLQCWTATATIVPRSGASDDRDVLSRRRRRRWVGAILATATLAVGAYHLSKILDRQTLEAWLSASLQIVHERGTRGLVEYTVLFAFWEVLGLSTSVVEVTAGMTFGIKNGILSSGIGKYMGSLLAFSLGRLCLYDAVLKRFSSHEVFGLIHRTTALHPLRTCLLMRYSSFPELVKNFGLSVLPSVRLTHFGLASLVHGLPFTILWTLLGNEARWLWHDPQQHRTPNPVLRALLLFTTAFGLVGSPAIMAWWVRDMRRQQRRMDEKENVGSKKRT